MQHRSTAFCVLASWAAMGCESTAVNLGDAGASAALDAAGAVDAVDAVDSGGSADVAVAIDAGAPVPLPDAAVVAPRPVWYWGDSYRTENESLAFVGYDQGCSEFGELADAEGGVSFRVGYKLGRPAADRLRHYGGGPDRQDVDDGPLAGYRVAGVVLLVEAVKEVFGEEGDSVKTFVTPVERRLLPPSASATDGSFSGTLKVEGGNPCAASAIRCRAQVVPTFVVVWQEATTRLRAYQFIRPYQLAPHLSEPVRYAACPTTSEGPRVFLQAMGLYWPLRQDFARQLDGAPEPTRWTSWIDEVLPR
jgi:hypothetical protein